MLEKHDWYYDFSDSHAVWRLGKESLEDIWKLAKIGGPSFMALYIEYKMHVFSGPAFGKPYHPKPTIAA